MSLHPIDAKRVGDLGLDYMIAKKLAAAAQFFADPTCDAELKKQLAEISDLGMLVKAVARRAWAIATLIPDGDPLAQRIRLLVEALRGAPAEQAEAALEAFIREIGTIVLETEGDKPFSLTHPLHYHISPPSSSLLTALALARHGLHVLRGGDPAIPLAAPLRPRGEVPPRPGWDGSGLGAVELVEVGDLYDRFTLKGHQYVANGLADLASRVRWRWVHQLNYSPPDHRPYARWACAVAEATREIDPPRFWAVVDRFREYYGAPRARKADLVLEEIADWPTVKKRVAEESIHQPINFDHSMAVACGCPWARPLFVIGTRWFSGPTLVEDLRQAIQGS